MELASYAAQLPKPWICVLTGIIAYRLACLVNNVFCGPLAAVPGPWHRAASRMPFAISILRGRIIRDAVALHKKYGPVVRLAPHEVSIAAEESLNQILLPSDQRFLKDPVWWGDQPGTPTSIVSAIDPGLHRRIRRVFAPSLTTDSIKDQEHIIQPFVDLLINRLRGVVDEAPEDSAVVNVSPWFNFITFDVFSALYFGQSFECLRYSEYHPWIALLYGYIKTTSIIAALRLYSVGQFILANCLPSSVRKIQRDHADHIARRVSTRLAMNPGTMSDLMSHIVNRDYVKDLPMGQFNASMMIITIAASETTAGALSATSYFLANNPDKLATLAHEIRTRFDSPQAITLDAVSTLPYLEAALNEGMRLFPPVPFTLPRVVPKGGAVVCGTWLPEGTSVTIQGYAMGRNPEYFHEPDSFVPERWLCEAQTSGEEKKTGKDGMSPSKSPYAADRRHASQPFGMGPRNCLGQVLAWAEMRLILAKMVWAFDLLPREEGKLVKTFSLEDIPVYILIEKVPIEVRLRPRNFDSEVGK